MVNVEVVIVGLFEGVPDMGHEAKATVVSWKILTS